MEDAWQLESFPERKQLLVSSYVAGKHAIPLWSTDSLELTGVSEADRPTLTPFLLKGGEPTSAILEYSGVDTEYQTVLLDSYFADPHINKAQFGLQGVLRGPAAQMDLIDSFPDLQLHQDMLHFGVDTLGDAKVGFRAKSRTVAAVNDSRRGGRRRVRRQE